MGEGALFKCNECGFEAELNLSQPDYGRNGAVEQFYCLPKNDIASIFLGLAGLNNVPKYFVCDNCAYNDDDEDYEEVDQKIWYETHVECRMENLQPLIIIDNEGSDDVTYQCPCKNCNGIMSNTHTMHCTWD